MDHAGPVAVDQYLADVNTTGQIQLDALSRGQAESEINEAVTVIKPRSTSRGGHLQDRGGRRHLQRARCRSTTPRKSRSSPRQVSGSKATTTAGSRTSTPSSRSPRPCPGTTSWAPRGQVTRPLDLLRVKASVRSDDYANDMTTQASYVLVRPPSACWRPPTTPTGSATR